VCKSVSPAAGYQDGARGWLWIKLKQDYRTELSDTADRFTDSSRNECVALRACLCADQHIRSQSRTGHSFAEK
jgi:ATP-dependent DNA ligase